MAEKRHIGLFSLVVKTRGMDQPVKLITDCAPEGAAVWFRFYGIRAGIADAHTTEWGVAYAGTWGTHRAGSSVEFIDQSYANLREKLFVPDELRIVGEMTTMPTEFCFRGVTVTNGYDRIWEPLVDLDYRTARFNEFFGRQGVELEGSPWAAGWRPDCGDTLCIRGNDGDLAMRVFVAMTRGEHDIVDADILLPGED